MRQDGRPPSGRAGEKGGVCAQGPQPEHIAVARARIEPAGRDRATQSRYLFATIARYRIERPVPDCWCLWAFEIAINGERWRFDDKERRF